MVGRPTHRLINGKAVAGLPWELTRRRKVRVGRVERITP
jgi:hypothetical protein